jgi:GNAT superfamily N-acetyltransferase
MGGPIKVNYRVKISSGGLLVGLYHGTKRIGIADAYTSDKKLVHLDELQCANNVMELAELFPEVYNEYGRISILAHYGTAEMDPSYRGKGIGKALYLAVAAEWFDENGPFIYIPSECNYAGATSADARRVWDSLARIFPSSGRAIAILKRPKLPSEITL